MSLRNNTSVYSTVEFDSWATRKHLIRAEKFLIQNYLERDRKTLEAGTGAGRILFQMKALGFNSLNGFDLVPQLVEQGKKKDVSNTIHFGVQDASCLGYKSSSFDQLIYLQQILCFIEDSNSRLTALKEAYRVLKPGGIGIFSFLSFDARRRSSLYAPYLAFLQVLRKLKRSNRSVQYLPWLRLGGKFNWASVFDAPPYVYWYRMREIVELLGIAGFELIAIGSNRQINENTMESSCETLREENVEGMLYLVCKKID